MRSFIDIIETQTYEDTNILYHGTTRFRWITIRTEGLSPDYDRSYRDHGPGVYLSDDRMVARDYGDVLLQIDLSMLDEGLMEVDDFEFADFMAGVNKIPDEHLLYSDPEDLERVRSGGGDWHDSLRITNQCKYMGVIPVEAITRVK